MEDLFSVYSVNLDDVFRVKSGGSGSQGVLRRSRTITAARRGGTLANKG